jgi:release factor glutamine methyltransferase
MSEQQTAPARPLTLGETLQRATLYFQKHGIESARLDAELIVSHFLGIERIALYTDSDRPLNLQERKLLRDPVRRRGEREPVAYIIGKRAFRRLDLQVNASVLVPRPETEILVEWAVDVLPDRARVLDWGTGSGAVALALATERRDLRVVGIDTSAAALAVAHANAEAAGANVHLMESDGFSALGDHKMDAIIANPPYLSDDEYAEAPKELTFEPREALVAGPVGNEVIDRIIDSAPQHLDEGGWLLMEVGEWQAHQALEHMDEVGFKESDLRHDLAGIPRAVGGHL